MRRLRLSRAQPRVGRLSFELTTSCNHRCGHCYNVWQAQSGEPQAGYEPGSVSSGEYRAMMRKAVGQTGADQISITGGEPLLREGAVEILAEARGLASKVTLVTNGSRLDREMVRRLRDLDMSLVQLTLLSGEPARHDALKGASSFNDTVRAISMLGDLEVPVQICFVATRQNAEALDGVLELGFALGVKWFSYNRMSPAGGAIQAWAQLMPTVEQIARNLATANQRVEQWGIQVGTAMPIMPCLVRLERYPRVRFSFCSNGADPANLVVDPAGEVRMCNLSSTSLGNFLRQDWTEMKLRGVLKRFKKTVPEVCRGCTYESSCQGGCKESAFAAFGEHRHPEPLLWQGLERTLPVRSQGS